jgi:hypothetical protein
MTETVSADAGTVSADGGTVSADASAASADAGHLQNRGERADECDAIELFLADSLPKSR